jgi:KEOPS complex subunit Cgi121
MPREKEHNTINDSSEKPSGNARRFCITENPGHSCSVRQVVLTINDIPGFLQHLKNLSSEYRSHIILFNEEMMAGKAHVDRALYHAFRAAASGTCISSSVEIEALLYAAGSRQVIEGAKFGIHQGVNRAYLCLCPDSEEIWRILSGEIAVSSDDWEIIDSSKKSRLLEAFNVTDKELAVTGDDRLRDLVIERVALLEVYK